ncbi:MAG TPA: hypothetical protein PKC69_03615 [Chitinophagaceae bacterium]|nr:hypothetical protein [Chitinophagaceae bacterium]
MQFQVVDFAKDRVVYNFTDCTREELENKLHLFFTAEGYKYKGDKDGGKIYTKGNKALRAILGAFWKYFKLFVVVKNENNLFSVLVQKDASGLMGGAVGMHQVKKEFTRITEAFKTYFRN